MSALFNLSKKSKIVLDHLPEERDWYLIPRNLLAGVIYSCIYQIGIEYINP